MAHNYYHTKEYQELQSRIMKENWKKGIFDVIRKRERRICKREGCDNIFEVKPSDPQIYCSHACSAMVSNTGRIHSEETKLKIGRARIGRPNPMRGIIKVPRKRKICTNCNNEFLAVEWGNRNRKLCSVDCAMAVIGGKPTSPKAARGKAGIRTDISDTIYFYSRWEANFARLLNHLKIEWQYAPKTFHLGLQNYTPDFYLPKANLYVEVKNFMWKYSRIRDEKFRKLYPNIKLQLFLKEDYLKVQETCAKLIKNWEYNNCPFAES